MHLSEYDIGIRLRLVMSLSVELRATQTADWFKERVMDVICVIRN